MAGKKGQKVNKETSKRSPIYYKKLHPDWSEEKCEKEAEYFRKSCNYRCIEYYEVKYPELSHEEHLKLQKEHLINVRKNNPNYIEYYKKNFPNLTEEELERKLESYRKSHCYMNIEYYLRKYPNKSLEECEKMLQEKMKEYKEHAPDLHGENNPMHHSKRTEIQIKEGSPMCLEFYKKRYPDLTEEEQIKLWKKSCDKRTQSVRSAIKTTNLEYYLNEGMSKEEAKKALHDRQATFSLDKCIKKYGKIEGIKRFNERQQKWLNSLKQSFIKYRHNTNYFESSLQIEIFKKLQSIFPDIENEYYIFNKKIKKGFSYDIKYKNKIIEVNGDYWHANPKIYESNFFNTRLQKYAFEIWEIDKLKNQVAKLDKKKIFYIWEKDYRENPDKELKKCIDFLND